MTAALHSSAASCEGRLLVFAKAPTPGKVKTRLVPPLSMEDAAALHRELILRTLRTATACQRISAVELWCAPDAGDPFFLHCSAVFSIPLRVQQGNDLGTRMHHAIAATLEQGALFALLIGTDCPPLTPAYLDDAASALMTMDADVILAPAEDGGYALVGMQRAQLPLFADMEWGNENVLEATRARIKHLGLAGKELPTMWDLDRPQDLARYRRLVDSQSK